MKLIYSFFLAIICAVLIYSGHKLYVYILTAPYVKEVEGMTWGSNKEKLTAHIKEIGIESEVQSYLLTLVNENNQVVFERTLEIDWDMFGSGIIEAMQVDNDADFEIVFNLTRKPATFDIQRFSDSKKPIRESFYLDINHGTAEIKDFLSLSKEVQKIANQRLNYKRDYAILLLSILGIPIMTILIALVL